MSNVIDTKENLKNISKIIPNNVLLIENDTGKMKIGNGTNTYANLDYMPSGIDIATNIMLGISKPDDETIAIDENGILKVKNISFEGGSLFAVLAGNNEGVFTNEGDGITNHQIRPNLSDTSFQKSQDGKSFCHIDNNSIVLDEEGFYIVRLRRAFYPDSSNTGETDLTESISYKSVGSSAFSNIGTQTLRMNNDPDLWQYCDFSIVLHGKVGDAISTLSYEPVVVNTTIYSGSFGLYVFKIPSAVSNNENSSVEVDNVTIAKNDSNKLMVIPEGFIDNNTIVVENGKIKSKSIPFDQIYGCSIGSNNINPPVVLCENLQIMSPNFASGEYNITNGEYTGVDIENNYVLFKKSGYYLVHCEVSFNSTTQDESNDIILIAYKNALGFSGTTVSPRANVSNPDYAQFTNFGYFSAGDKLFTGYCGNVNVIQMFSFGMTIARLPATNEYQIQNAIYSGIYTTTANPYIIQTDGGKVELTLPSNSVQENSELIELTSSGRAKIKKSGIYFVKYTCTLNMGDQGQLYDTNLIMNRFNALNQTTDNIAGTSWLVSEQSINPNTGTIYTVCPFSEGDEVFVEFSFPVANTFYLTVSSNFCLFPSVTDNIQSTASTTKAGLIQLATEDQALIGTEANTALTPATGSKMAAHMAMPSNNVISVSISGLQEDGSFMTTAPDDGYFSVYGSCNRAELTGMSLNIPNSSIGSLYHTSGVGQEINLFIPVSKGNQVRCFIGSLENWSNLQLKFTYANGSVPEE